MLAGDVAGFDLLRQQLASATTVSRTYSGVGVVTRIAVPASLAAVPADVSIPLRPLLATHPRLPEGTEFLLQLRNGRLAVLEAYCLQGDWPVDEQAFRIAG